MEEAFQNMRAGASPDWMDRMTGSVVNALSRGWSINFWDLAPKVENYTNFVVSTLKLIQEALGPKDAQDTDRKPQSSWSLFSLRQNQEQE